jgi:hypothetical protein
MTNPNYIANKGKGKCPSRRQKQTGSNDRSNKHVSLLEFGCKLSDSQPEKDRKKEPEYSAKLRLQKDSDV